jgi:hypothetical protein
VAIAVGMRSCVIVLWGRWKTATAVHDGLWWYALAVCGRWRPSTAAAGVGLLQAQTARVFVSQQQARVGGLRPAAVGTGRRLSTADGSA